MENNLYFDPEMFDNIGNGTKFKHIMLLKSKQ